MIAVNFDKAVEFTEDEAREYFEKVRWDDNPACPRCGGAEPYRINSKRRKGLWTCKACRQQFTVTIGTVFERSHISLKKWLMAICLITASKKGISAHQIHRMLGMTYKTAFFMMHRLRYAMAQFQVKEKLNGTIEVDETYIGGRARGKRGRGADKKSIVVSLVERNGMVRSKHVDTLKANELKRHIRENVTENSNIMTDDFKSYKGLDKYFKSHNIIQHSKKQYVKGIVHTNTAEGFFSLLKRGINGTFHHVSQKHLHRYLSEFDFRYNLRNVEDSVRAVFAIRGSEGKRLMCCHSS